jgi:hypothetical protein
MYLYGSTGGISCAYYVFELGIGKVLDRPVVGSLLSSFFKFLDPLLEIRSLDCAYLQVHQGCQAGGDPRVDPTLVHFFNESGHCIANGGEIVQFQQGKNGALGGSGAITSAPDSTQLRRFLGVCVEEAQTTVGRGRPTRLAKLGLAGAMRVVALVSHFLNFLIPISI